MNPLLPVTEPCGGSVSGIPFSFTNSKVLLLAAAEPCVGLLCLVSSHSVPFSIVSAGGEEASLAAISLSPSMEEETQTKCKSQCKAGHFHKSAFKRNLTNT